jgi:hypothetical protein
VLTVSDAGRSSLLMVGPLRGPDHLALIHRLHFYHVPVEAVAPSRTAVACIAFYEGAGPFGHRTGCIREYAAVVRVSRVARRDLPGLTWAGRHRPEAPYLRFDLGPIQQLDAPITNPERLRVVFRFTDLGVLQAARTVRDLGGSARRRRPSTS